MPGMDGLSHHVSGETPKKCDSFHPYTTTWLCKACNGPAYEHVTFMKHHEEKEAKKAKDKPESYDQKRARVLEYARTIIDPPVEPS